MVLKSVILNDLKRRYFIEFVYDVVVKKFTFAISSPDEFLVIHLIDSSVLNLMVLKGASAKCVTFLVLV